MAVKISEVKKDSLAQKAGILNNEQLVSVNDHAIIDVLDYRFYITEENLKLEITSVDGETREVQIKKDEYEDIGLEFDTYLMDEQRSCRNKCIFCFIDQMPKGLRESLYFKDDDTRMSFLFGNYITLTNIKETDIERIISMHISPINISVHTTNPELRVKMMKNKNAGESLKYIPRLAEAGISINCQLVLCPGINDGDELKGSLGDLGKLYPNVQSVSCVPVGITDYRDGLFDMQSYNEQISKQVVDIINDFADEFQRKTGSRLAYPADEFFLKAGIPIPSSEYYGEFSQLENGVGLIASLREEFHWAVEDKEHTKLKKPRKTSLATGVAACDFLGSLVDEAKKKWHNLDCNVYGIINDFFGHQITVAGLVTGQDLIKQLKGKDLGSELLIPSCMLRKDTEIFLDDVTVGQVEESLGIKVRVVENDGYELLDAILGE
ncbi:MAG: hypothetical protein K0R90_1215 [Oscillospiraceae bacterium]|jgi:putative radical SAM enzyme (TIGR03279 family)|nr:hypothetical protein [Oscillospiraceae bacterium]